MRYLVHDLVEHAADRDAGAPALADKARALSYGELATAVRAAAGGLLGLGLGREERVAIWLDKRVETVVAMFGAAAAGGVYVPVNPLLRPPQVAYILRDCGVRVLVTSPERLAMLAPELEDPGALAAVVLVGDGDPGGVFGGLERRGWDELLAAGPGRAPRALTDADMTAILYTSGSTGMPKGVVLSHRNVVTGGKSVSSYLGNRADDRILAVLPLSFDAGMSQLTTGFCVGAQVVLLNYLLARDVVRACTRHRITGLTCVPPLWMKLVQEDWPAETAAELRYFANTGGHMPRTTLDRLRAIFANARPYLMYGLTEAFRSTYLDPDEVDRRPDSIGKAIPNAEVLVVRPDGTECAPGEVGELVHRGALVSLGYWNAPELTAIRFKPAPGRPDGVPTTELAVWSGDLVRRDEDGFLYFVGRNDDMIKTSGYRVSPSEVEEAVLHTGLVREAAAIGVPDEELGQVIVVLAVPAEAGPFDPAPVLEACRKRLPLYMVPKEVQARAELPRNANGKIDRPRLKRELTEG
ncbi:MAG: acyl-CoA ligase (AMP-forming), exosortase A system-associated [Planctomycetota bacterium]